MIVIIDDDTRYCELLKRLIRQSDYRIDVREFHVGLDAINFVEENSVNVVILDLMIPFDATAISEALQPDPDDQLPGVRILQRLIQLEFDVSKVLVVTTVGNRESWAPLLELGIGVQQILVKPVDAKTLCGQIMRKYRTGRG